MEAFQDATKDLFGYLLIVLKATTPDFLQVLLDKPKSKTYQLRQNMKDRRDHTAAAQMSQLFGAYIRTKASEKPSALKPKQDNVWSILSLNIIKKPTIGLTTA